MAMAWNLAAQTDCSDIFISEYVEGWYNNKALELYNPSNAPITLDNFYRLVRYDNGNSTSHENPLYVLPLTGTIDPYKVMVIIQDTTKPGQDTMVWPALRKKGTFLAPYDYGGTTPGGNCVFWNGDDAVSLQKLVSGTWKDIDIFGEIGVRPLDWQLGTTGAWTDTPPYWRGEGVYLTKDQTLIRKKKIKFGIDRIAMSHYGDTITGIYPNSFNAFMQYDSMPANFFDSLGHHVCDCQSLGMADPKGLYTFAVTPNPVTNGQFTVSSGHSITAVEVLSIVGQPVWSRRYATPQRSVKVAMGSPAEGIYLVRVTFSEAGEVVRKIVIR